MEAWVTLATNDSYAVGALVLAASLRKVKTTRKIVIVTTSTISSSVSRQLNTAFDEVIVVEPMDSGDLSHLQLMNRPELGVTFTKLHVWTLTQFTKCVYLDADTLVVLNCDDMFDNYDEFSAAPDAGWPDCFNSGVFVFRPNLNTFKSLIKFASEKGSFDGGDQGLLNHYFSSWARADINKHLPFLYNMCATSTYTYLPAYKFYGGDVRIIHFIGMSKPWHVQFDKEGKPQSGGYDKNVSEHLQAWWTIFSSEVKPDLDIKPPHIVPSHYGGGVDSTTQSSLAGSKHDAKEDWERGTPDFRGTASFDNIIKKIESTMSMSDDSETPEREDVTSSSK